MNFQTLKFGLSLSIYFGPKYKVFAGRTDIIVAAVLLQSRCMTYTIFLRVSIDIVLS